MVLVSDVAEFIHKISFVGGIYNLTDGCHPNFYQLSSSIGKHLGKKPKVMNSIIAKVLACSFEIIGRLLNIKPPFNKRLYYKMTKSLVFCDDKAKLQGWSPKSVLLEREKWL